jgi:hypothetical protein
MARRKRKFGRVLLKLALPLVKRLARGVLDRHKADIIRKLNHKVNLPKLSEQEERQLLEALYDVILTVLDRL